MQLRASSLLTVSIAAIALLVAPNASAEDAPPPSGSVSKLPPPVPPYLMPEAPPPLTSPGLTVAGIVVGSAGFLSALTGLILMTSQPDVCPPASKEFPNSTPPCTSTRHDIGFGMLLAGAPVLGIGVGMIIFGTRPASPSAARAGAVPIVAVGPGGGSLRWQF